MLKLLKNIFQRSRGIGLSASRVFENKGWKVIADRIVYNANSGEPLQPTLWEQDWVLEELKQ